MERKKAEFVAILNDKDATIQDMRRDAQPNLTSILLQHSPILQSSTSVCASRDFQAGCHKLLHERSLSPRRFWPQPRSPAGLRRQGNEGGQGARSNLASEPTQASTALQAHRVTNTELSLYQTCQKMVDAASQMECAACMQTFPTTDFYEHVTSQAPCAPARASQRD